MKKINTASRIESGNDRRQFLKLAGYGALGVVTGSLSPFLDYSAASDNPETTLETDFIPDLDFSLEA